MFEYLYEWIQNLAFYLVIVTAVIQILPGKGYKKYVQFFSGLVMILLMLTPILKLTGMEGVFREKYYSRAYQMEAKEIEKQEEYLKDLDIMDFLPEEFEGDEAERGTKEQDKIEVEEIRVGQ